MSVLSKQLEQYVDEEIVVVMMDNRAFRGTLVEFDEESLVLRNVVEALPNNAGMWEEPTVSTSIKHKIVTWHGTFSHEDGKSEIVRLKDAVIRVPGVLRIWQFSARNIAPPEHVEREGRDGSHGPAAHVSRG